MVSPLHADGTAWAKTDTHPGHSFARARKDKGGTYKELLESNTLRLLVAGIETGGRMSKECMELLEVATMTRAQSEPKFLRRQAARAWKQRSACLPAVAGQNALAATLVDDGARLLDAADCPAPAFADVWLDAE